MAEPSSPEPQKAAPRSNARIVAGSMPEEILSERRWQALIIASTAAVLLFSVYCLSHGITVVFMHLYYFPIVLLAYRYRYRGFSPAALLAITYVGLVYFYDAGQANIITEAWYRVIVFIGIAAVIAYLSEQLASAQKATWEACEVRERYLTLAPAIVIALDSRGAITYLNEQGCNVLGCKPEDVIGKSWSDLFVPEKDRDRAKEIFRQIMAGQAGPDRAVDNPVLTRGGAEKIFRWHNSVLHDEDGTIAGTLGFGEEVTGQIQAEEKIRKLQQFQESVITNANVWITVLDPRGNILLWNDAAEAISGYPKSDVLATATVWKRLYPDKKYRGKVTGDIRRIIERDNYLENFETEIQCGDSSKKAIVWNTRGLKNTQGMVTSYIAIGRDITAQKIAEEEARRSSELYREFFTTSRDCIFITSPQGQWIDFNESALELFGYGTREELARVPLAQLYRKAEDRGAFLDYIEREGYAKEYPVQLQRRDGTVIDTLITTEPIRYANGSVRAYVGTIRDITERRQAEQQIEESSRFLATLMDTLPVPIFYKDVSGKYLGCNPPFEEYIGIPRNELIGKTAYDISPKDLADRYTAADREIFDNPEPQRYETQVRFADGSRHDVIFYKAPFFNTDGSVAGLIGTFLDITERKRVEEALKESEEKFRDIFNNANDAIEIHAINADGLPGKYIDVNDVGCRMLQYTRGELLALSPLDVSTDYYNRPLEEIGQELRTKGSSRFETYHRRKDGTIVPVEINAHVVSLRKKEEVIAVVRDITERKQAEEALQKASKKISMLSSITRHDIRNQLMALRTYIELLKDSVKDAELLEFIIMEDRIAEAIGTQIEFTKYYEDIGVNAPKWQDIPGLILSAKSQLREYEHIEVAIEIPPVQVYADALIEKVFYNLMENSVRHGVHVTRVVFSFRETGDGAVIIYEDNGAGISPEDRQHLFEKGFGRHTGLGLFLSREILTITGLTIRESGEPGKGARFEIAVPEGMYRFPGGDKEHA
ncbi:MAG: PAS domain S-box protein [Methanoregula sp.]|jgi:PAS domain S-box-containing protein|uniref:PAS domain S-box protein n=1 Tax=Methanoregula sp. TaxID=2052170 RepID=UPI003D11A803